MANNTLLPVFNEQFFIPDPVSGLPVFAANCQLYTYVSGTTTLKTTTSDQAGAVPNPNPIILDSQGRCKLFGTTGDYTLKLLTSVAAGSALVWTIDGVTPQALATGGSFLPLAGGTMTGPITLASDATAALQPTSLQQMNAAILSATTGLTTAVAAATAAAAAATAAAASITSSIFSVTSATNGSKARTVTLSAGTWEVRLESAGHIDDSVLGVGTVTVTQAATVGTTTVNTSYTMHRTGGGGYGRNNAGYNKAIGTLTVGTTGPYTLTLAAAVLGASTGDGSTLWVEKQ